MSEYKRMCVFIKLETTGVELNVCPSERVTCWFIVEKTCVCTNSHLTLVNCSRACGSQRNLTIVHCC